MSTNTKKLSVRELTKIFPHPSKEDTKIPLLAGVTFAMSSKELNFIVGPSGSGKTTLLRILMSIEPIDAGEIFLGDLAVHKLKGKEKTNYLSKTGYVDQFPAKYLSLNLTAAQNLDLSILLHDTMPAEERQVLIHQTAEKVGIEHLLDRKTLLLSGGELRRLSLACNIIFDPLVLFCDEPTAQLDEENKQQVIHTFERLQESFDSLIIIATHDRAVLKQESTFEISNRRVIPWQG